MTCEDFKAANRGSVPWRMAPSLRAACAVHYHSCKPCKSWHNKAERSGELKTELDDEPELGIELTSLILRCTDAQDPEVAEVLKGLKR